MKGVARSDEPTENYYPLQLPIGFMELYTKFQLIV